VDFVLLHVRVLQHLLDRSEGGSEEVHVQLLEFGPSHSFGEIFSFEQRFDFEFGLVGRTQSPLCLLNFPPKFLNGPLVGAKVFSGLLLEDLDEMLHDSLVKVLTSKMGVSVAMTSKTPSAMVKRETSKVPPPRSKTRMFFSPDDLSFRP